MKVCGFTFIKNAVKFDFPVVEAITSVLPLCDHFIVAVGDCNDGTRELIKTIDPLKIEIVETVWNSNLNRNGEVYASETNKALDAIPDEYDWCFYIQGDEVVHEKYLPEIKKQMLKHLENSEVEGLLLGFKHFYGTYDYVGDCRHWYRKEIRVVRNDKSIRSYRDAQGFRKSGRKLGVVPIEAEVFHYGWVRHPKQMLEKVESVKNYYDGLSTDDAGRMVGEQEFSYGRNYDALAYFEGTHPEVMKERIKRLNWKVEVDLAQINLSTKYRLLYWIEKQFGFRPFEYRNYRILKK